MPSGFFFGSEMVSQAPVSAIPRCGACGLFKTCKSPKMDAVGAYKRKILLVGQSPGRQEDEQGEPFVGPSGHLLKTTLKKFGVDMKRDCLLTNAMICHPTYKGQHDKFESNSDKLQKVGHCRANLMKTIKEYEPEIIIPLGYEAVTSLIGWLYKGDIGDEMTRWLGWQIPEQTINAWICPTWHPSFLLHQPRGKQDLIKMYWEHHLKQALKKKGRPWDKVPNYKSQVELIKDPDEAARIVRMFRKKGGFITFDYETNRLKPDNPNRLIVSCSVCWRGKRTIAFLWEGPVVKEMKKLLSSSSTSKGASNIKFEDRWTRAELGIEVANWKWCTMNNAHICDNRSKITGIEFQSFVRLGFPAYSNHITKFLTTKRKETKLNQILEEIELDDLLLYNGLDSLLEYHVAIDQAKQLNLLERLK